MKRKRSEEQEETENSFLDAAFSHKLDLSSVCDENTMTLVQNHAQAIGVQEEYVLFPLLASVAALMANSTVEINPEWCEPVSLWTAVVAFPSTRKSSALNRLFQPLKKMQTKLQMPRLLVYDFLLPDDLKSVYTSSPCSSVALLDDILQIVKELLKTADHHYYCLHQMKNLFDNTLLESRLSIGGFTSPEEATIPAEDQPPVFDRFLLCCPEVRNTYYRDLCAPMPETTPSLEDLFYVLQKEHQQRALVYRFQDEAHQTFVTCHNHFTHWEATCPDKRQKQLLRRAPSFLARCSCVLAVLRQALALFTLHELEDQGQWKIEICIEDVNNAAALISYCLAIRFSLEKNCKQTITESEYQRQQPPNNNKEVGYSQSQLCISIAPIDAYNNRPTDKAAISSHRNLGNVSPFNNAAATNSYSSGGTASLSKRGASSTFPLSSASILQSQELSDCNIYESAGMKSEDTDNQFCRYNDSNTTETRTFHEDGLPEDAVGRLMTGRDAGELSFSLVESAIEESAPYAIPLFLTTCGRHLRRFLEFHSKLTPSVMSQRHLMPSLTAEEAEFRDSANRFPVSLAQRFLRVVEKLGFGIVEEAGSHGTRKSLHFVKKPFVELGPDQLQLLNCIQVSESKYSQSFMQL